MHASAWLDEVGELRRLLAQCAFTRLDGGELSQEAGFAEWHAMADRVRGNGGALYLIGNGASASMASHFAADLAKNGHMHAQVFSDLSLITAVSNDMGFENVFSEPLRRRGKPGDMLVAISSSGRSPNLLAAARVARELDIAIVTVSAMKPDNPLRLLGDLNVHVPAGSYGHAETCHAAILHHWMESMDRTGV